MLKPLTSLALAASITAPHCLAQLLDITPPGAAWARALSVSDDGNVVAGEYAPSFFGPAEVFLWSATTGYQFISSPHPPTSYRDVLVSGDGQAVAINGNSGTSVLWRQGGVQSLTCSTCGAGSPVVGGISSDGTRLAGNYNLIGSTWEAPIGGTASGMPLFLPGAWATEASAISSDGLKVAGRWYQPSGGGGACVWDLSGSSIVVSTFPWDVGWPLSISGDGNVVAGNLSVGGGAHVAVRWSIGGSLEYLDPLGYTGTVLDANNDGSVVVGWNSFPNQQSGGSMWTQSTGMVELQSYLPTIGISTSPDFSPSRRRRG